MSKDNKKATQDVRNQGVTMLVTEFDKTSVEQECDQIIIKIKEK